MAGPCLTRWSFSHCSLSLFEGEGGGVTLCSPCLNAGADLSQESAPISDTLHTLCLWTYCEGHAATENCKPFPSERLSAPPLVPD